MVIFLCVQLILCFWHYFVHAWVPCSTGLATLANVKQAHANSCATVLSQRPNNHTPSPQYAAIHVLHMYVKNRKPVAVRMANTGTSMVDCMKIFFFGPATSYHAVRIFLHMRKMLSTLRTLTLQENIMLALRQ